MTCLSNVKGKIKNGTFCAFFFVIEKVKGIYQDKYPGTTITIMIHENVVHILSDGKLKESVSINEVRYL